MTPDVTSLGQNRGRTASLDLLVVFNLIYPMIPLAFLDTRAEKFSIEIRELCGLVILDFVFFLYFKMQLMASKPFCLAIQYLKTLMILKNRKQLITSVILCTHAPHIIKINQEKQLAK